MTIRPPRWRSIIRRATCFEQRNVEVRTRAKSVIPVAKRNIDHRREIDGAGTRSSARVVAKDVDLAELGDHVFDHCRDFLFVRDVGFERKGRATAFRNALRDQEKVFPLSEFFARQVRTLTAQVDDDHARALARQPECDSLPDPLRATRARNHGHSIIQSHFGLAAFSRNYCKNGIEFTYTTPGVYAILAERRARSVTTGAGTGVLGNNAKRTPSGTQAPSALYRNYMIVLLTAGFGLNLLDRQVINVLAEAIKHDLRLADWQLGALTGLSFAVLYSVVALPIARLADCGNRVRIIGFAILGWSVFTACCGMAASFIQLLIFRVGVGVGEAGCSPPSQSLISDVYPPSQRSGALGIFGVGSPVGAAVGLAAGGLLAETVGWRWTLILAGLPGVAIGLLVLFTLREPRKTRTEIAKPPSAPIAGLLRRILAQRAFVFLMLGIGLLSFVNVGAMAFATSFYLRVHRPELAAFGSHFGLGPTAIIGLGMGFMGATAGGAGTAVGGWLGNRWGVRNVRAFALIPAMGSFVTVFGYLTMFTLPSGLMSLVSFVVPAFFSNLWNGPGTVALLTLAGHRYKATAMAVVLLSTSILGLGLGPLTIGLISDFLRPKLGPAEALQAAILVAMMVGFASACSHWIASLSIGNDMEASPDVDDPFVVAGA